MVDGFFNDDLRGKKPNTLIIILVIMCLSYFNFSYHLAFWLQELGGNSWWFDRFLAQHIAIFYYFMTVFMYAISPRMACKLIYLGFTLQLPFFLSLCIYVCVCMCACGCTCFLGLFWPHHPEW